MRPEGFFVFSHRFFFILEGLNGCNPNDIPFDHLLQIKGLKQDIHSLIPRHVHELHGNLSLNIRVNDHIVTTHIT